MGMQRRGDGRVHHVRPHVRQVPSCRQSGLRRSRPEAERSSRRAWAGRTAVRGKGGDTITSGLEGAWTNEPTKWEDGVISSNLFKYDWELTGEPAGAKQWTPRIPRPGHRADAHGPVEACRPG